MLIKEIQLNNKDNLNFNIVLNKFYLEKKDVKTFLCVPQQISVKFLANSVQITAAEKDFLLLNKFFIYLNSFLKEVNKVFVKKLVLKGLGLKVNELTNTDLQLKLGFSHLVNIPIPQGLIVKFTKSIITIQGCDLSAVGNFASLIKKKKLPDAYKGKGLWYKNEKLTLKTVKKT